MFAVSERASSLLFWLDLDRIQDMQLVLLCFLMNMSPIAPTCYANVTQAFMGYKGY